MDAFDVVVPPVGIAKRVLIVGAAIVMACVLGWVVWKIFFAERAAERKAETVRAESQGRVNNAQNGASQHAVGVVSGNATKETIIRETTRTNTIEITKQPGAGDPVSDAVDTAGRRAICLRASAAGFPECQRLQASDSE